MLNVRTLEASGLMGEYHRMETYWTKSYWIIVLLRICWHCLRLGGSSHSTGGGGDEGLRSHMTSALGGLLTRALNNFLDKNRSQPSPPVTQVPRYEYMSSGIYKDWAMKSMETSPWEANSYWLIQEAIYLLLYDWKVHYHMHKSPLTYLHTISLRYILILSSSLCLCLLPGFLIFLMYGPDNAS
jgi:hypothetical protein